MPFNNMVSPHDPDYQPGGQPPGKTQSPRGQTDRSKRGLYRKAMARETRFVLLAMGGIAVVTLAGIYAVTDTFG